VLLPLALCLLPALAACEVRRDRSRQPPEPPKSAPAAAAAPEAWRLLFDPLDAPPEAAK
jgi:hypothetical protein